MNRLTTLGVAIAIAMPTSAHAQLAKPVRDMIDAAIASGDVDAVATVLDLARQANPDAAEELDGIAATFATSQEEAAALASAQEEEEIRNAGLLDNWSGQGEIGAFRATGNTSETGLTAAVELRREGIDWEHQLRARADYQKSSGVTTREQFLAAYQPRYNLSDRIYLFGLAQWERDRFQGFDARYSVSGGVGYRVFDNDSMRLLVEGGPAWRRTEFSDGTTDQSIAGYAALDYDWQVTDRIAFTQDASVFLESGNTTLQSITGLEAGLGSGLTARASYTVEHDTNPPAGAIKTDTLTRFTLIYGF